jgi:outer membrane lipoprotein-sorting protein
MEGPEDPEQIREMLGIPLKAEELTALALGDPFFLPVSEPTVRMSVDQNALLLDVESSDLGPRYQVWLDEDKRPARMFVTRPHGGGRTIGDLQVEYGRYRTIDGVSFPHRIRVAVTGSERVLKVDYQKVLLNESLEENLFRFVPPEGATQSTGSNR